MPPVDYFAREPFEFAQKHPIQAHGFGLFLPDMKEKFAGGEKFFDVKSQQRIAWLNLVVMSPNLFGSSGGVRNGFQIEMKAYEQPGFVPIYWLPWATNQVYRITLRPSKKAFVNDYDRARIGVEQMREHLRDPTLGDQEKEDKIEDAVRRLALGAHGTNARLFLTSAVQGCSIYVEGREEEPTVYHANAKEYKPPYLGYSNFETLKSG